MRIVSHELCCASDGIKFLLTSLCGWHEQFAEQYNNYSSFKAKCIIVIGLQLTTTRSIIGSLCGCFACGNVSPLGCHLRYSLCALAVTSCRWQLPPTSSTLVAVFNLFGIHCCATCLDFCSCRLCWRRTLVQQRHAITNRALAYDVCHTQNFRLKHSQCIIKKLWFPSTQDVV